jgi:hypothetical protein
MPLYGIPAAAIGSTAHTSSVNRKAFEDVKNKDLANQAIGPNDTMRGVVFFDVTRDRIRSLTNSVIKASFLSSVGEKIEIDIHM